MMYKLSIKKKREERGRRGKKPKSCFDCLEASKYSPSLGKLEGKVYCHKWRCVVFITHAKICPFFTSIPQRRRGNKRKGRRW